MVSFVETFDPGDDRHERTLRGVQRLAERVEFLREQRAGARDLRELRDAVGGRLRTMRGAERVVDVDVAERGHLLRERVVVLLLALVDAAVLEQHHLSGFQRRLPRRVVDPVRDQRDVALEQSPQPFGDRLQRVLGLELSFGRAAEVRRDHHDRARLQRGLDRRHRRADARVVGDTAVIVLWHVEVGADEHPLVRERDVGHPEELHAPTWRLIRSIVASSMRLLKPHSLSYHDETFTSRPRHLRQRRVERRRCRVVVEVVRDERVDVVVEDALEFAFGRGLHDRIDLVDGRVARRDEREVDDGHVDGRHANREAVELARELGHDEPDRRGRAGLRGDHRHRRAARAAQVLVIDVGQHLVVRVRVDRRHQARDEPDLLVQRLDERREAVRRATAVRDDGVARLEDMLVDAVHDRRVDVPCRQAPR